MVCGTGVSSLWSAAAGVPYRGRVNDDVVGRRLSRMVDTANAKESSDHDLCVSVQVLEETKGCYVARVQLRSGKDGQPRRSCCFDFLVNCPLDVARKFRGDRRVSWPNARVNAPLDAILITDAHPSHIDGLPEFFVSDVKDQEATWGPPTARLIPTVAGSDVPNASRPSPHVLCTDAAFKLGKLGLYATTLHELQGDLIDVSGDTRPLETPIPELTIRGMIDEALERVDTAFSCVTRLRYQEYMTLEKPWETSDDAPEPLNPASTARLRLTAMPSGESLGSAIWVLSEPTVSGKTLVVLSHTMTTQQDWFFEGMRPSLLSTPPLVVITALPCPSCETVKEAPSVEVTRMAATSSSLQENPSGLCRVLQQRFSSAPTVTDVRAAQNIIRVLHSTLESGGSVQIPVDVGVDVLKIFALLAAARTTSALKSYPVTFVCPVGVALLDFAKGMLEWTSESLRANFSVTRHNPFARDFSFVRCISSFDSRKRLGLTVPQIIVSTPSSITSPGLSCCLFGELIATDPASTVLFLRSPSLDDVNLFRSKKASGATVVKSFLRPLPADRLYECYQVEAKRRAGYLQNKSNGDAVSTNDVSMTLQEDTASNHDAPYTNRLFSAPGHTTSLAAPDMDHNHSAGTRQPQECNGTSCMVDDYGEQLAISLVPSAVSPLVEKGARFRSRQQQSKELAGNLPLCLENSDDEEDDDRHNGGDFLTTQVQEQHQQQSTSSQDIPPWRSQLRLWNGGEDPRERVSERLAFFPQCRWCFEPGFLGNVDHMTSDSFARWVHLTLEPLFARTILLLPSELSHAGSSLLHSMLESTFRKFRHRPPRVKFCQSLRTASTSSDITATTSTVAWKEQRFLVAPDVWELMGHAQDTNYAGLFQNVPGSLTTQKALSLWLRGATEMKEEHEQDCKEDRGENSTSHDAYIELRATYPERQPEQKSVDGPPHGSSAKHPPTSHLCDFPTSSHNWWTFLGQMSMRDLLREARQMFPPEQVSMSHGRLLVTNDTAIETETDRNTTQQVIHLESTLSPAYFAMRCKIQSNLRGLGHL